MLTRVVNTIMKEGGVRAFYVGVATAVRLEFVCQLACNETIFFYSLFFNTSGGTIFSKLRCLLFAFQQPIHYRPYFHALDFLCVCACVRVRVRACVRVCCRRTVVRC